MMSRFSMMESRKSSTGGESKRGEARYLATTVQKALHVLGLFREQSILSFADIRERLGLNKSTLFRLLYTLEQNEYVSRDESGRYSLGVNVFILGHSLTRESVLRRVATPSLVVLSKRLNMTVHLGILEGTTVVILQKIESSSGIKTVSRVGAVVPPHCTGQGKTLLAHSAREKVEEIISIHGLTRYTPNTITTANGLFEELAAIRTRGYTIDNSEHERHIKCVAVPILNEQGGIEAALSVTGLAMELQSEESLQAVAAILIETAQAIRRDLGFCREAMRQETKEGA
jgi:IclR family transcriptional regulator, KDG regulon repressor